MNGWLKDNIVDYYYYSIDEKNALPYKKLIEEFKYLPSVLNNKCLRIERKLEKAQTLKKDLVSRKKR